jgi:hypothetical protein
MNAMHKDLCIKKVPCPEGKSVKLVRAEDQAYVDVTPEPKGPATPCSTSQG